MSERFSLKDHLFNAGTLGQLASEYASGIDGFDATAFLAEVLPGLEGRELKERLEWIADCLEPWLSDDFPVMADQLEAAMSPPLDPTLGDDDFGQFIHAVPGILAVRHGLENHRDRALDLLEAATQRFSMEFYIRPFIDRWPDETLGRLDTWCGHRNYHVRRLVSEGTRPKLPWARKLSLDPIVPLRFLDRLFADATRYVTRSVANHLNDIAKINPGLVIARLEDWAESGTQDRKEMAWITSHALRGLIKEGHPGAMALLGYDPDAPLDASVAIDPPDPEIGGDMELRVTLCAAADLPVLVDFIVHFRRPGGKISPKVFKLKQTTLRANRPQELTKRHRLRADATTFTLVPGPHLIEVQVNGVVRAATQAELQPAPLAE